MGNLRLLRPLANELPEGHARITQRVPMFDPPDKYRVRHQIPKDIANLIRETAAGHHPWPLYLFGEAGSGKTCASLCCIDAYGGWFLELPRLCEMLIQAQRGELRWESGHARTTDDIWKDWRRANITVLDEIGTRNDPSEFHYETLKRAIDEREGLPSVLISNHDVATIATLYDGRIASRLCNGTFVLMNGDRRLAKKLPALQEASV